MSQIKISFATTKKNWHSIFFWLINLIPIDCQKVSKFLIDSEKEYAKGQTIQLKFGASVTKFPFRFNNKWECVEYNENNFHQHLKMSLNRKMFIPKQKLILFSLIWKLKFVFCKMNFLWLLHKTTSKYINLRGFGTGRRRFQEFRKFKFSFQLFKKFFLCWWFLFF